jgi:hypothetical protein
LYTYVTRPALVYLGADVCHHVPGNFEAALAVVRVAGLERSGRSLTYGSSLEIYVSRDNIPAFWSYMDDTLLFLDRDDLLWEFSSPFFVFDAPGYKL